MPEGSIRCIPKDTGRCVGARTLLCYKMGKGIYKPSKRITEIIASYFLVSDSWLKGDSRQNAFTGTVLTPWINDGDRFAAIRDLLSSDGFTPEAVFYTNTEDNRLLALTRQEPRSSVFVPTRLGIDSIQNLCERPANLLVSTELSQAEMTDHRAFSDRETIEKISHLTVTQDCGSILCRLHGGHVPGYEEKTIREAFDLFVKHGMPDAAIEEAYRRYRNH